MFSRTNMLFLNIFLTFICQKYFNLGITNKGHESKTYVLNLLLSTSYFGLIYISFLAMLLTM